MRKQVARICCASLIAGAGHAGTPVEFLRLPTGFHAEILVDNVPNARSMTLGEKGTLFIGTMAGGQVYAVRAHSRAGRRCSRWPRS